MLTLTGQLVNTFKQPKGEKDGKEFGGQDKVQILGNMDLPNGETKMDMYTLTTHDIKSFEPLKGKNVSVSIGVLASGKNVVFFIPKTAQPRSVANA